MTTITYRGKKIAVPDWPGVKMQGGMFARDIRDACSIGYGRCSSNPGASRGTEHSADTQEGKYGEFCRYWGTTNRGWHADPNSSAGISAEKERENFAAAMEKVRTDPSVKLVWVMTSSRFSRGDISFDDLIIPLIENGVLFAVGMSLYNPAEEEDRQKMLEMYTADSGATIAGKKGSSGGKDAALADGRAIAREPYGLTRDRNRKPVMDIPDETRPEGQPAADTPARVVREIFRRIADRDIPNSIALDFERRKVLIPRAARGHALRKVGAAKDETGGRERVYQWTGQTIRGIAANPVYIGLRRSVRLSEPVRANVVPLIAEDLFYAAQRALTEARTTRVRHSPRNTMLSSAAFCGVCGMPLGSVGAAAAFAGRAGSRGRLYGCRLRGHASIREDYLDQYVSQHIIAWLLDPLADEQLHARREDDMDEIRRAEAEADRLQVDIDLLIERSRNPAPGFDVVYALDLMTTLRLQQAEARQVLERFRPPSVDKEIADLLGPGAEDKWFGLSNVRRRKIVMKVARVTLRPVPAGEPRRWAAGSRIASRIGWEWKLRNPATGLLAVGGPATAAVASMADLPPYVPADEARAGRVAAWLAAQDGPRTVYEIADGMDEKVVNLWRALDVLLEDGRVVKEHGTPNRNNRWFYALAR
jgi:hypothetical protein